MPRPGAPPAPGVGARPACLPGPVGHRPGAGGPARSAGRRGGVREPAGERPAALPGAPGWPAREGEESAPKLAMRSGPRRSLRISLQGLVKGARGPGSRTRPLRSFKVAAAPPGWRQQVTGRDRSRAAPPPPAFSFFSLPFPSPPPSARRGAGPQVPGCVCVSAEKVFASLPQVERGVSKIVGGDPKGNSFLYTNGKCVILRNIDVSTSPPAPPAAARAPVLSLTTRPALG